MSDSILIDQLVNEALEQMERDTLIKSRLTSLADMKFRKELIWQMACAFQNHADAPMRIFGLVLNWMATNKTPVMLLSENILNRYLSNGEIPRKTCDSRTWKQFEMVFTPEKPYLIWLEKGRIENGKRIAGTIELVHPLIRAALVDYLGGVSFFEAAKVRYIEARDRRTPVVVPVTVDVTVSGTNHKDFQKEEEPNKETLAVEQNPLVKENFLNSRLINEYKDSYEMMDWFIREYSEQQLNFLMNDGVPQEVVDEINRLKQAEAAFWQKTLDQVAATFLVKSKTSIADSVNLFKRLLLSRRKNIPILRFSDFKEMLEVKILMARFNQAAGSWEYDGQFCKNTRTDFYRAVGLDDETYAKSLNAKYFKKSRGSIKKTTYSMLSDEEFLQEFES